MAFVTVVGKVNREVKTFDTANGGKSGVVSVQESRKNKDGEWENLSYDAWFYGKPIEWLEEYYPKGKPIVLSGELTGLREWTSNSSDATGVSIVVRNCSLVFIPTDQSENGNGGAKKKKRNTEEAEEMDFA